ncbi:acyl carrier protein [Comamonas sp. JUb58]|uniref:acyl carrier protein n=1 Tax=Comamonas sp. JUb58 TaxID=2485114 RepID=UPI0010619932|nr:acyl carrier protein [Comamonas sp. JUb58]TDS69617.1 acyl carrier protein [Comamonas sp. JUb58]
MPTSLLQAKTLLSNCLLIPLEHIGDDANVGDLRDVDSLMFEGIVIEIENATGNPLDVMDLLQLRTVRDVAKLLNGRRLDMAD